MDLSTPTSIALIGGGLAACSAAAALRDAGYDGIIRLISDEAHLPYDRPPLSKGVLGDPDPGQAGLITRERAEELGVELVLGERVEHLDLDHCTIELASGQRWDADRVLIATGGTARTLTVPGADLPQVTALRTWEDAVRLRDLLDDGGPVVIVGGGFIGLEVAAAARARGCEVTVIEQAEALLGRVLPTDVAAEIARRHRAAGIAFAHGVQVERILGDGEVTAVELSDGSVVDARVVVVGIGMIPAVDLAVRAGLEVAPTGGGILTDANGQTNHPRVFAAGDVAASPDPWHGTTLRIEQWQSAEVQGAAAARAMLGLAPATPPVPWFWSDQGEVHLQVAGVPSHGDAVIQRGSFDDDEFATLHLSQGRVVGAVALGRPQDVRGAMKLIESGIVVEAERLADLSVDLRRLARRG